MAQRMAISVRKGIPSRVLSPNEFSVLAFGKEFFAGRCFCEPAISLFKQSGRPPLHVPQSRPLRVLNSRARPSPRPYSLWLCEKTGWPSKL